MSGKIILSTSGLIELYMSYDFFDNLSDKRENLTKGRISAVSFLLWIALCAIRLRDRVWTNVLGLPALLFLYSILIFDTNYRQRLRCVMIVIAAIWSGRLVFMILLPWQPFSAELMAYFILVITKQTLVRGKHRLPLRIFFLYICQPVISLTFMIFLYYVNVNAEMTDASTPFLMLVFAFLMTGNILMFHAFDRYAKQAALAKEQEMTILRQSASLEYYMQVAQMNQQHRKLIHDTSHYMKVIGELAREKENERVLNLVQEITGELEHIATMVYCANPVLNAVLQESRNEAVRKKTDMDIYVEPEIRTGEISDMDMVTMLGNLLDNAVLAAADCEQERYVRVRIFMNREKGFLVCKVTNSYSGELLYGRGGFISTRNNPGIHGIGLKNVEKTAQKYGGYLDCSAENQTFTAVLLIKAEE